VMHNNEGYIIDYGSSGWLTKKQQCKLITAMIISSQFRKKNGINDQIIHSHNQNTSEKFVKAIWDVCDVKDYSHAELKRVSAKILNYEKGIDFGSLFLGIVEHSEDIGSCSNNAILLFGRALAYLSSMMLAVTMKCNDKDACPRWAIDGLISLNLATHPSQLWNFWRRGKACASS
jgi:hypothetical protein